MPAKKTNSKTKKAVKKTVTKKVVTPKKKVTKKVALAKKTAPKKEVVKDVQENSSNGLEPLKRKKIKMEKTQVEQKPEIRVFQKPQYFYSRKTKFFTIFSAIIISAVVTFAIVLTVPLWMNKLLPAEKQPAFLRKALTPVTQVKVIETEPIPNDIQKDFAKTKRELKQIIVNTSKMYAEEVKDLNSKVAKFDQEKEHINLMLRNNLVRHKVFFMAFDDMYDKALKGMPYDNEVDLLSLNLLDKEMKNDFYWIVKYKSNPPRSLEDLRAAIEEDYSELVLDVISKHATGLKEKWLTAYHRMFKLRAPSSKLRRNSFEYNLTKVLEDAVYEYDLRCRKMCSAMRHAVLVSNRSPLFEKKYMKELEARYRLNRELIKLRSKLKYSIFKEQNEMGGK